MACLIVAGDVQAVSAPILVRMSACRSKISFSASLNIIGISYALIESVRSIPPTHLPGSGFGIAPVRLLAVDRAAQHRAFHQPVAGEKS
jgi:hypothetical protein